MYRFIEMSTGKIPVDKEAIQYVDPKKMRQQQIESSTTSGDENDDWRDVPYQDKKRRHLNDDSSESADYEEILRAYFSSKD